MNSNTAYMQLGQVAVKNKNFAEAVECFSNALAEQPKDAQIIACLGQSLCWLGKRKAGIDYLHKSGQLLLKKARKTRDLALVLGMVEQLQYWNDYAGAVELCKQAVLLNAGSAYAFYLLSLSHSVLNQKKSALAAGRQAYRLEPENAVLAIHLATLEAAENLINDALNRLQKILQNPLLSSSNRFRAHKETARLLDKTGQYAQVFTHLQAAAEVAVTLPEVQQQNLQLVPTMLESYKQAFDTELLARWANVDFSADQPAPIFLLGFMRTGTTLTQEVLGTHPQIFVADETDLIMSVVKELARISHHQGAIPEQLRALKFEDVLYLRSYYWNRAKALYGEQMAGRRFLDKTTMNSIDLGLINCLFPDAKLIFLLRDPRDVCLSCFMQIMIPTPSTVHLFNWQHTARFYAQVMAWWLTIKPKLTMQYRELRYEDAVTDFETTFRAVFEFLDLTWEPAVKEFHQRAAGKYIASPSFSQVAKPLYASSVGRWQFYTQAFEQIKNDLQPYIIEFGYRSDA